MRRERGRQRERERGYVLDSNHLFCHRRVYALWLWGTHPHILAQISTHTYTHGPTHTYTQCRPWIFIESFRIHICPNNAGQCIHNAQPKAEMSNTNGSKWTWCVRRANWGSDKQENIYCYYRISKRRQRRSSITAYYMNDIQNHGHCHWRCHINVKYNLRGEIRK